ncbi:uncharacterized protein LOC124228733 isoform X2 [Equus quagga]|uniref:uncharacterized protein LOC124228733 isoform X2 n=1 Tax=Equus quagga TaxID=89248 RepID=UPI001EE399C7|nr:uncharacterized protein LOC124228733 isoform X2 [Equus quagga]
MWGAGRARGRWRASLCPSVRPSVRRGAGPAGVLAGLAPVLQPWGRAGDTDPPPSPGFLWPLPPRRGSWGAAPGRQVAPGRAGWGASAPFVVPHREGGVGPTLEARGPSPEATWPWRNGPARVGDHLSSIVTQGAARACTRGHCKSCFWAKPENESRRGEGFIKVSRAELIRTAEVNFECSKLRERRVRIWTRIFLPQGFNLQLEQTGDILKDAQQMGTVCANWKERMCRRSATLLTHSLPGGGVQWRVRPQTFILAWKNFQVTSCGKLTACLSPPQV